MQVEPWHRRGSSQSATPRDAKAAADQRLEPAANRRVPRRYGVGKAATAQAAVARVTPPPQTDRAPVDATPRAAARRSAVRTRSPSKRTPRRWRRQRLRRWRCPRECTGGCFHPLLSSRQRVARPAMMLPEQVGRPYKKPGLAARFAAPQLAAAANVCQLRGLLRRHWHQRYVIQR